MKRLLSLAFLTVFSSLLVSFTMPAKPTYAACGDAKFLTMPAWYRGVAKVEDGNCNVSVEAAGGLEKFIWTIAFNIVEIMLNIVAYITIGFIIYGGFKYMISGGSESGISAAKKTIMNAVIGLLISMMSIGIVNFVSNSITQSGSSSGATTQNGGTQNGGTQNNSGNWVNVGGQTGGREGASCTYNVRNTQTGATEERTGTYDSGGVCGAG